MRILLVEDNPKMATAIRQALEEQGYHVDYTESGFDGEEMAASASYDVIVLDLMLPDRDGLEVCRNLRRRKVGVPVLILTALSGLDQKVDGLDAGADDYLTKPFQLAELLARVRALSRRGQATEAGRLKYADLELDLTRRSARRDQNPIKLSAKEFILLELLMRNADRVLPRSTISEHVWDTPYEPASNVIEVVISNLRRKVDRGFEQALIHTVIGTGYRFGLPENEPAR